MRELNFNLKLAGFLLNPNSFASLLLEGTWILKRPRSHSNSDVNRLPAVGGGGGQDFGGTKRKCHYLSMQIVFNVF